MIYTDGIHLISDTSEEELHHYARLAGIKRCWYHSGSAYPHYDVPKRMRGVDLPGATLVDSRKIVEILNSRGFGIRGKK